MALYHTAHVVVHVAQLLAIVDLLVLVVNVGRAGAEVAVLSAVGKRGEALGQAIAQGRGVQRERVDGQVLGVAGAVVAPGGDEGEGEEKVEEEGYAAGDDDQVQDEVLG